MPEPTLPFLLAALYYQRGRCNRGDNEGGLYGPLRFPLALFRPRFREGHYRYFVVDGEAVRERRERYDRFVEVRERWDREAIARGLEQLDRALELRAPGPYQIQAAIAALHAQAPGPADTDWAQIAALYGTLAQLQASPVIELNRAVAVAMAEAVGALLLLLVVVVVVAVPVKAAPTALAVSSLSPARAKTLR